MKKKLLLNILIYGLCILAAACKRSAETSMPNMRETYNRTDHNPMGASIAYRYISNLFNDNYINNLNTNFTNAWNYSSIKSSIYICLTKNLYLNKEDAKAMMAYVANGNDIVIAAQSIDENLLSEINCKQNNIEEIYKILNPTNYQQTRTILNFFKTDTSKFSFYYYPFLNNFIIQDSVSNKVLGTNTLGKPNAIVHFKGKGRLFLFCNIASFSNYFLLQSNNFNYLENALAFTINNPTKVFWDNYYAKLTRRNSDHSVSNDNTLSEILKYPALKIAFWLSLILFALYLFFSSKRKQRIIPVQKTLENNSINYVETIAQLYFQHKDNKAISSKMILYFNEFIRSKYFLNTNNYSSDFKNSLSKKTGVPYDKIDILYNMIQTISSAHIVDNFQLISLNEQIEYFYKNIK